MSAIEEQIHEDLKAKLYKVASSDVQANQPEKKEIAKKPEIKKISRQEVAERQQTPKKPKTAGQLKEEDQIKKFTREQIIRKQKNNFSENPKSKLSPIKTVSREEWNKRVAKYKSRRTDESKLVNDIEEGTLTKEKMIKEFGLETEDFDILAEKTQTPQPEGPELRLDDEDLAGMSVFTPVEVKRVTHKETENEELARLIKEQEQELKNEKDQRRDLHRKVIIAERGYTTPIQPGEVSVVVDEEREWSPLDTASEKTVEKSAVPKQKKELSKGPSEQRVVRPDVVVKKETTKKASNQIGNTVYEKREQSADPLLTATLNKIERDSLNRTDDWKVIKFVRGKKEGEGRGVLIKGKRNTRWFPLDQINNEIKEAHKRNNSEEFEKKETDIKNTNKYLKKSFEVFDRYSKDFEKYENLSGEDLEKELKKLLETRNQLRLKGAGKEDSEKTLAELRTLMNFAKHKRDMFLIENKIEEDATILYEGKSATGGEWTVAEVSARAGLPQFAKIKNNTTGEIFQAPLSAFTTTGIDPTIFNKEATKETGVDTTTEFEMLANTEEKIAFLATVEDENMLFELAGKLVVEMRKELEEQENRTQALKQALADLEEKEKQEQASMPIKYETPVVEEAKVPAEETITPVTIKSIPQKSLGYFERKKIDRLDSAEEVPLPPYKK